MAWIKKDTRTLKDPKIVELLAQPKGAEAYVLWDAALFEAYHQTPKGEFANEAHLKACVAGVADIKVTREVWMEQTINSMALAAAVSPLKVRPLAVTRTRSVPEGETIIFSPSRRKFFHKPPSQSLERTRPCKSLVV